MKRFDFAALTANLPAPPVAAKPATATAAPGISTKAHREAIRKARAEGRTEGRVAERKRIAAIFAEAGKGREALAFSLAVTERLSVADARARLAAETPAAQAQRILASAGKAKNTKPTEGALAARMVNMIERA